MARFCRRRSIRASVALVARTSKGRRPRRSGGTPRAGDNASPDQPAADLCIRARHQFDDHFLPVCQASIDLLEADKDDFEARCRRMLDTDGVTMIDELCAELQTVGRQMQILVDGLELTRARLRTAVARLADERLQETN